MTDSPVEFRDEFEARSCRLDGISLEKYRLNFVTLPCSCGSPAGPHWARLRVSMPAMILDHIQSCTPTAAELEAMSHEEFNRAIERRGKDHG